jgi:hypothetical protein
MSETTAIMRIPTGLGDRPFSEQPVTIVGFCYGKHLDALGYGRSGECTLAVVSSGKRLLSVPIDWLTLA